MKVYGIKSCDTMRKAMKALAGAGHAPELVDLRDGGVQPADLERFFAAFGPALVNRRSTTWRQLDEAARGLDAVALISAYPAVMKRPVIEADGALTLGWDGAVQARWLGKPA